MRNTGLALKLALIIVPVTLAVFLLILGYNYHFAKKIIISNVEENSKNIALNAVNKIENYLKTFEIIPENIGYLIENSDYSNSDILDYIRSAVNNNKDIFGSTIAFEPFEFNPDRKYFAPYYFKNEDKIDFKYLGSESYQYFNMDWYQIPKALSKSEWSEPYFDEGGGNILMATYSVPFYRIENDKKIFNGVITADIALNWLNNIVSRLDISRGGYCFLITRNGTFLTHPNKNFVMNESIFSVAEAGKSSELRTLGRKMIDGKSGFELTKGFTSFKNYWIYYSPLQTSGWSLGIMFPEEMIMSDVNELGKNAVLISIEGILILILVIIYISRNITKPLRKLADATKDIASGNLEFDIPDISSNDEVGNLSRSFDYMKGSLKQYISDLKDTTAIKERIESELKIARDIQMGIINTKFPAFPERTEFEIFASIKPAREVGGDFYDFFFIDDNNLYFLIGDVSDKGVPASLFMAVTKTLIKAVGTQSKPLNEILYKVNNDLCADNEMSLFVTLFCGILDTSTGEVTYTNCGHNSPLYVDRHGNVYNLEITEDMAVGVFDNVQFHTKKIKLDSGESIFLYTDGVTDAGDSGNNYYGLERLKEKLKKCYNQPTQKITEYIDKDINEFSGNVSQSDDITIVSIKYNGMTENFFEIEIRNNVDELEILNNAVSDFSSKRNINNAILCDIQLVLEEIITNIIKYGYPDNKEHIIKVKIIKNTQRVVVEIVDDGVEFNPLDYPEPDINKPLEERQIGGLGIHLVRNCMNDLRYERINGTNKVIMIKNI